MSDEKKGKKQKQYGVFQVKSPRHGTCWAYSITWFENGIRHRKKQSGFPNKTEAEAVVNEIKRNARLREAGVDLPEQRKKVKTTTIKAAVAAYLEFRQKKKAGLKKSHNVHRRDFSSADFLLNRWAAWAGEDRAVKTIDYDDMLGWVDHELKRGTVKLHSISRSLNSIRACLRYASEKFEDLKSWRVPKKPLKAAQTDNPRQRPLEEEEIALLAQEFASKPKYIDALHFLAISLGTASRMDEILSLRWSDVNFKNRTVKLFASKTQKEKDLQIEAVVDLIETRRKMGLGNEIYVFACRDHWIRKAFREAATAVGIPYGQANNEGDVKGFTPHDLRGTALTALLMAGVDLATVSKEYAAHGDMKLTARYLNPTKRSKQLAAQAANNLVGLATKVDEEAKK